MSQSVPAADSGQGAGAPDPAGGPGLLLVDGRALPPPGWHGWRDGRAAPQDWPTAVAVRAGRVVAVGSDAVAREAAGDGAEVIDLAGRLVVPGFIDAHAHPLSGGWERQCADLSGITDAARTLAAVARYARAHPEEEWVRGGGWSMSAFPGGTPRAADLDAVVGDRPAFLPNRDHHSAWVSSAALRLAGIDSGTPDPPGGRIERDPDGTPTGTLHESAMDLVDVLVPQPTEEQQDAALEEAQRYLHALGVTGWQDAIVGESPGFDDGLPTYLRAQAAGRLRADVVAALWWPRGLSAADVPRQVAAFVARRSRADAAAAEVSAAGGRARVRARNVKIMLDGVAESFTASMHEPYLHRDSERGISYLEPDLLDAAVTACAVAGFGVHVHAIGDRAVSDALSAFAAARAADGTARVPHQIAHLQIVGDADVPRWAELGVIANMQALWACHEPQMDELTLPFLGPQRAARQYPFGDLHAVGVPLAMGSDWPVSSADPLAAIHVAVNRMGYGENGRDAYGNPYPRFLPEQALDVVTALHAYTAGSAAACWLTDVGALRPGARADLVVLDRDPVSLTAAEIGGTRVDLTLVDGVAVYQR